MTRDLIPVSAATGPQSAWLVEQLPVVMGDDEFLRRFLGIFEEILDSVGQRIDGFEHFIDLSVAPIEFVRWMGRWVGLEVLPTLDPGRQRDLVRKVGPLFAWRGTGIGLQHLLEAVTGESVTVIDGGGVFGEGQAPIGVKRVDVEVSASGALSDEQVAAIVHEVVPADVLLELRIGGRVVPVFETSRPAPRLEQAPTPGETALLGFVTGGLADDAALPTDTDDPSGVAKDDGPLGQPPDGEGAS